MKLTIAIVAAVALAASIAQAHRMTSHDYRQGHWCQWSAAVVCSKWRANGGRYPASICPPGSMSSSCRAQRAREAR
jgi:hypothetical protein